ncbi:MAG: phosphoenolpyruvate-utilizing N-terminal domain-containing protein [Gemmatimonadales bacterium]
MPNRFITDHEVEGEIRPAARGGAGRRGSSATCATRVRERAGREESHIFDAQIMLAEDAEFLKQVEQLIRESWMSAETAYEFKALEIRNIWTSSGNALLRDRLADLSAITVACCSSCWGGPRTRSSGPR